MNPKISILMGIYNCASTLPEAIDSILAQTYPHWELILCDDGSSDDTYAVADAYRQQYPDKIVLIKNEQNMGLNVTLNNCLAVATGEYIARMDGDDISLPNRFETELAFLEAHPDYAVVSCPMIYFDEDGDFRTGGYITEEPTPAMLVHGTIHCHAPCMVCAEVMRAVGGYSVSKKLLRVEDWHLWLKIYAAGYRGHNLSEPLYKMRDDRAAAGRRKFRFRLNESRVILLAVKTFHLPFWKRIFALRPILVGLLPKPIYNQLHRRKFNG
ncbi:MAG: glycosyltransferase [Oscillospiraceae bacterium]|nr:glycosyltransferase [Oscillospiraceae bacterium]